MQIEIAQKYYESLMILFEHVKNDNFTIILNKIVNILNSYQNKLLITWISVFFLITCSNIVEDFVYSFNNAILDLHIDAKKSGIFVNLSPCQPKTFSSCDFCLSKNLFEIDNETHCKDCGIFTRQQNATSWSDITRVNTTPKYFYDRKVQFKDHLLQFQGKGQIDETFYQLVKKSISKETKLDKQTFFNKIKQLSKNRTHYDQVHSYYYNFYSQFPPDLSRCENQILNDFDKFNSFFENKNKTFSNNQMLLFQLLKRYGIKISKQDLLISGQFPDEEMIKVFRQLGWKIFT